eukprot:TRINITY_DN16719_c0_g1_i3.p1 TRINITY_DN16719_c0_g1~~TRINITY_DN16719_c0_g1_i3.p1  ORF type:complete len:425 (+),score=3.42 TRINITY_DN16719_c0_g1_i3:121-1395(+)
MYSELVQTLDDNDYNNIIRAPRAPQVPLVGSIEGPSLNLSFNIKNDVKKITNSNIDVRIQYNGWLFWDVSSIQIDQYMKKGDVAHTIYLPCFNMFTDGIITTWQVCLVVDHFPSVYLGSMECGNDHPLFLQTTFSLQMCSKRERDDNIVSIDIAEDIQHLFQRRFPWWGVTGIFTTNLNQNARMFIGVKISKCQIACARSLEFSDYYLIHSEPFIFKICDKPSIMCVENFLEDDECNKFIEIATPYLSKSLVQSGGYNRHRQSQSMFFIEDLRNLEIVRILEDRLLQLVNLSSVRDGQRIQRKREALQVIRYKKGNFYKAHLDNKDDFDPIRSSTVIIYLSNVEEGGCTYFKLAQSMKTGKSEGIRIQPKKGRLIIFWNHEVGSSLQDPFTLHEAEAVLQGEKWIITRWYKDETNLPCCQKDCS